MMPTSTRPSTVIRCLLAIADPAGGSASLFAARGHCRSTDATGIQHEIGKAAPVSSAAPRERRTLPTFLRPTGRAPRALWLVYAVMGTLLAAYIVSLMVRSSDDSWPWIDGWGVAAYEVILGILLVARAFSGLPGRAVPLVLGSAVLAWACGDAVLTWESWG